MPYLLSKGILSQFFTEQEMEKLLSTDQFGQQLSTVGDLFQHDISKLKLISQKRKLPFEKLIKLREFYGKLIQSSRISICDDSCGPKAKCGSSGLNFVLDQLNRQNVIEIVGGPGSGKTQLALSLALESALNNCKVIFIDCDLSFSNSRLVQIIENEHPNHCEIEATLSSIKVYTLFKRTQLIDLLELICKDGQYHQCVLIIDSLTSVLFTSSNTCECDTKKELYRKRQMNVEEFCHILRAVTHVAKLLTFITRLQTNELKFDFQSISDLSILLSKESPANCKVKIENHSLIQQLPSEVNLQINNNGIQ